ncbi:hypothetical protein GGR50DRAFT_696800 [Xylaria sp. CBS 124048]|nr:hypothetical protein GGR50DRAFT_696800 [Xylaria sp. CBS 124048]
MLVDGDLQGLLKCHATLPQQGHNYVSADPPTAEENKPSREHLKSRCPCGQALVTVSFVLFQDCVLNGTVGGAIFAAAAIPLASADGPGSDLVNNHYLAKVVPPPGMVQAGALIDRCGAWTLATSDMTCYQVSKLIGVEVDVFEHLNPQLKGNCARHFWAGYYYCTGLAK